MIKTKYLITFIGSYLYTEQNLYFLKYLVSVKQYRVFSSKTKILESSPATQFHKIKKYDRKQVITGFMRDYIYEPRNFATL